MWRPMEIFRGCFWSNLLQKAFHAIERYCPEKHYEFKDILFRYSRYIFKLVNYFTIAHAQRTKWQNRIKLYSIIQTSPYQGHTRLETHHEMGKVTCYSLISFFMDSINRNHNKTIQMSTRNNSLTWHFSNFYPIW